MFDRNIRPDSITYNTLMFAGAQAKMPGKVLVSILVLLSNYPHLSFKIPERSPEGSSVFNF